MKAILTLFLLSNCFTGLCQDGSLSGRVIDSQVNKGFAGVTISLEQANAVVKTTATDSTGGFLIKNIPTGAYIISVDRFGFRTKTLENITVSNVTPKLTIPFPGPCEFIYTEGKQPSCIGGHTEQIIPIVYGKPGGALIKKAKKGEALLRGCIVPDCPPKYYCTIHKKEL